MQREHKKDVRRNFCCPCPPYRMQRERTKILRKRRARIHNGVRKHRLFPPHTLLLPLYFCFLMRSDGGWNHFGFHLFLSAINHESAFYFAYQFGCILAWICRRILLFLFFSNNGVIWVLYSSSVHRFENHVFYWITCAYNSFASYNFQPLFACGCITLINLKRCFSSLI